MANKLVRSTIKHYHEEFPDDPQNVEVDKTKSISELSNKELSNMIYRLRTERDTQQIIRELKRNSGERDTYENPFKVDTTTPIKQLYHHGILGQKWGIRRFQNKDGTRTAAGKKREQQNEQTEGKTKSTDHMTSRINKTKGPEELSNDELKQLNTRLQLEKTYRELTTEKIQKSESWVAKALTNASEQALTDFTKNVFLGGAKVLVREISPEFAEIAFGKKVKKKEKEED